MKKIIVPTDFSKVSANAFAFAKAFSEFVDIPIKALHVTHSGVVNDLLLPADMEEYKSKEEEELSAFVHQFDKIGDSEILTSVTPIEQEVVIGLPIDKIVEQSREEDCEYIIMGTSSMNGLTRKIFGSVSIDVAQQAHCPVWLIPPNASFEGIQNILYTGSYESSDTKMLDAIIHISDVFDSIVHLLHVNVSNREKSAQDFENMLLSESYKEKLAGKFPLDLKVLDSDYFWKGVNTYVKEKNIDLIVMVTRHRSFLERLIHKSMTKTMILHTTTPILILHLDDEE